MIFFSRKKKYVYLPYLKFSDPLRETYFFLALVNSADPGQSIKKNMLIKSNI